MAMLLWSQMRSIVLRRTLALPHGLALHAVSPARARAQLRSALSSYHVDLTRTLAGSRSPYAADGIDTPPDSVAITYAQPTYRVCTASDALSGDALVVGAAVWIEERGGDDDGWRAAHAVDGVLYLRRRVDKRVRLALKLEAGVPDPLGEAQVVGLFAGKGHELDPRRMMPLEYKASTKGRRLLVTGAWDAHGLFERKLIGLTRSQRQAVDAGVAESSTFPAHVMVVADLFFAALGPKLRITLPLTVVARSRSAELPPPPSATVRHARVRHALALADCGDHYALYRGVPVARSKAEPAERPALTRKSKHRRRHQDAPAAQVEASGGVSRETYQHKRRRKRKRKGRTTEAKPQAETEPLATADSGPKADAGAEAESLATADSGPKADAGVEAESLATADSGPKADAGVEAESLATADSGPKADAGAEAESLATADSGPKADAGAEAEPVTAADLDPSAVPTPTLSKKKVRKHKRKRKERNGGTDAAPSPTADPTAATDAEALAPEKKHRRRHKDKDTTAAAATADANAGTHATTATKDHKSSRRRRSRTDAGKAKAVLPDRPQSKSRPQAKGKGKSKGRAKSKGKDKGKSKGKSKAKSKGKSKSMGKGKSKGKTKS
ncbi:uncharacterized protein AMSG_04399 [Thecamonas trahens ATCC 50062]|uniref:Uncharacterized protein n=1 Tax=Thecamonas trahens ATCC 50062 TaxID=461836 RepID=A0A0L0D7K1_THETB|nr:hypothetical protein AMSG_04399 [Thecamonas trahens ATCC 50062]KNC48170.1 hypothetical protein AMSG_04399 [Thecamonas trahens ATCC 50062]|eukprot:XP_013758740.1 hypothetical protein AMSG_04399 [Thecamonas trahens ATCC 50062]